MLDLFWHLHFPDVIYSIDQHYPGSQEHLFLSLSTFLLAISLVIYSLIYVCVNVCIFSSSLLIKLNLVNVKYYQKLSNFIQMTSCRTSAVFIFLILTFIPNTLIYNICMNVLFEISMYFLLII